MKQVGLVLDKILWDDLYNVQMPLLGIKYSADDLIVLGTATMTVLALWFLYAHRRENHCIGDLTCIATNAPEPGLASFIHSAVAHHFVFTTTTTENEVPDRSQVTEWFLSLSVITKVKTKVNEWRQSPLIGRVKKLLLRWPIINKVTKWWLQSPLISKVRKLLLRWPIIGLVHLPWVSSILSVGVMLYILFVPGVRLVVVPNKYIGAFWQFELFEQREALLRLAVGLIFTILTMYYCFRAQGYDRQTHRRLVEMKDAALADQNQMAKPAADNQSRMKKPPKKRGRRQQNSTENNIAF